MRGGAGGGGLADLELTKAASPDPVERLADLTYTVTVTNRGPDGATGVKVVDWLPTGATFVSATPAQGTCSAAGVMVTCEFGNLAAGAGTTVEIVVQPTAPGSLTNTAYAAAFETDPVAADNTASVTTTVVAPLFTPDISVLPAAAHLGAVAVGGASQARTLVIENAGDGTLALGNLSLTGADAAEFDLRADGCSSTRLAPAERCTVDVVFAPSSEGAKSAAVSVPSNDPDENPLAVGLEGFGAVAAGTDYSVLLHSRIFVPPPGLSAETRDQILQSGGARRHVLLQTRRIPTTREGEELRSLGVRWLHFLPNFTWYASVPVEAAALDAIAAHGVVRALFSILPEDRLAENLGDGVDARLRYPDGTVALEVRTYPDVRMAVAHPVLASLAAEILDESEPARTALIRIAPAAIPSLAQLDFVELVTEVAPPAEEDNDQARLVTNVSNVQVLEDTTDGLGNVTGSRPGSPYVLDGSGVRIGQWEVYHPDCSHPDFGGFLDPTGTVTGTNLRVTFGDATADCRSSSYNAANDTTLGDHPTHVAGTVLGNGSQSAAGGGLPLQYRGMAPNASIIAYQRPNLDVTGPDKNGDGRPDPDGVADAAPLAALRDQYVNALAAGIVLSTNSWGFSHCFQVAGSCYEPASRFYDELVGGLDEERARALSVVASAGNQGPAKSGVNWGTVRIPNSAKNTLVVGNIRSDDLNLSGTSSRGPVDDGRLKPDVVAPGDEAGTPRWTSAAGTPRTSKRIPLARTTPSATGSSTPRQPWTSSGTKGTAG
ncbi:MAG: choice-of-anchor D domain-containing protein [Deltaproteobacteria bacterium]|nr:choice-of-anchor D domain-containing protein [Deltaproteobacteria bacterium]